MKGFSVGRLWPYLQEYTFTIAHHKETLNGNVDALSQRPHSVATARPVTITFIIEGTTQYCNLCSRHYRRLMKSFTTKALSPTVASITHCRWNVCIVCRMYQLGLISDVVKVHTIDANQITPRRTSTIS